MKEKEFLTVLIFILIIGIVFICQDLSKGATIMSFIIGFIVLRNNIHHITDNTYAPNGINDVSETKEHFAKIPTFNDHQIREQLEDNPAPNIADKQLPDIADKPPRKIHLAEREYLQHQSYNTPFEDPKPITSLTQSILDSSIDSANTMMVRARTRDKRCITGAVIKDANFYKKHYGDEFEQSENSRWWSAHDY